MDVLGLIGKLGKKENSLVEREFISPVCGNDTVVMKLDGIIFRLSISKLDPGWYKFRPIDSRRARVVYKAEYDEIEAYLKKLPQIRVSSCYREGNKIFGFPLKNNKAGLPYDTLVPVFLPDDQPMDFDRLLCRFDGVNLWYENLDTNNDPFKSYYLRESLVEGTLPKNIHQSGLSLEEKAAYYLRFDVDVTLKKKREEQLKLKTLEGQVAFQGGKLLSYSEKSDHLEIEIEVEGQRFRSYVSKDEYHRVITAGICLDGMDESYDLTSLISVFREGIKRDLIHKTLNR
jgi:hypothetical protein